MCYAVGVEDGEGGGGGDAQEYAYTYTPVSATHCASLPLTLLPLHPSSPFPVTPSDSQFAEEEEEACGEGACVGGGGGMEKKWVYGAWGTCSDVCDPTLPDVGNKLSSSRSNGSGGRPVPAVVGTQTRTRTCVLAPSSASSSASLPLPLPDSECGGVTEDGEGVTRNCNENVPCVRYMLQANSWSPCSRGCGGGEAKRSYECVDTTVVTTDENRFAVVNKTLCAGATVPGWFVGVWRGVKGSRFRRLVVI